MLVFSMFEGLEKILLEEWFNLMLKPFLNSYALSFRFLEKNFVLSSIISVRPILLILEGLIPLDNY